MQTTFSPLRIKSIDVFRAVTMFLMIFVNDVAGVKQIPEWLKHTDAEVDGMGFSDVIFPAFLFIVGLSLPLAFQYREKQEKSVLSNLFHVGSRSLALVIMGLFHVNFSGYISELTGLAYPWYVISVTTGFFLVWMNYPKHWQPWQQKSLVGLGILLLGAMAYIYQGGSIEEPRWMKTSWWGILGIIGWAYFFSATLYLFLKGRFLGIVATFVLFALINVGKHTVWITLDLWMIGDASSITLIMGGVITTLAYQLFLLRKHIRQYHLFLLSFALLSISFGFLIRPYGGGISKIYATPAWVFICMGLSILSYQLFVYLVDQRHWEQAFSWIKPAGTSTLTCYLMPYYLFAIYRLIGFRYPEWMSVGYGGMIRSALVAFLLIQVVAFLEKKHIRLKI